MWKRVLFLIVIFSGPLHSNVCANSTDTVTDVVTQIPIGTTTTTITSTDGTTTTPPMTSTDGTTTPTPSTVGTTTSDRPRLEPIVVNGEDGKVYTESIDNTIEFIYLFTFKEYRRGGDLKNEDIRLHVEVDNGSIDSPVTFVVKQRKSSLSWQLPVVSKFDRKVYRTASRTLCIENNNFALQKSNNRSVLSVMGANNSEEDKTIIVSVSTSSLHPVQFSVNVSRESNFVMSLGKWEQVDVSPLSPRFFEFVFPNSENRFVLLEVKSNDSSCMTVSVQNASCPILDQENNVQFEGYWQTMSKQAGMTLRKEDFPNGFYLVFVMHGDDTRCKRSDDSGGGGTQPLLFHSAHGSNNDRTKIVEFAIYEKISDIEYLAAIFGTSGIFALVYVFVFIISCTYSCRSSSRLSPVYPIVENGNDGQPSCSSAQVPESGPISDTTPIINQPHNLPNDDDDDDSRHWLADSDSSLDETDIDFMDDANREKDVYRTTRRLCVAALARKNPRILAKKSQLYLYTLFTVAVFYGLPVVQLVFTYQKVLHTTGNEDLCYYNYLCSHPLWLLSDFNHVYSNIGYIMLGLLFLVLVLRKERIHERLCIQDNQIELTCGIPRHYGLFYAMGFALIMEGCLSACYHVCPNHSNFQFDTCFMYVNAILCMLKIYQTRHPDINASAYMAFTSLAFVVLLGVVGVMAGNIYFWIFFTTFHVLFCTFMSVQIYYLGRWKLDCGVFQRIYQTWKNDCIASPLLCLTPLYLDRMVLLTIANICNWTIAGYGMWKMPQDFASHLLLIFMSNLFLYSNFYILMKLTHREKITCQPAIYILLSVVSWGVSMYVFLHKSTSWQLSPAESRTFNRECMLLGFYDTHDIWHFLSAFSMFFSFMILLTLDDDLIFVPRTTIAVF